MGNDQSNAAAQGASISQGLGSSYWNVARPQVEKREGLFNAMIEGGYQQPMARQAWRGQRVGLQEGMAQQQLGSYQQNALASKGAVAGGNMQAALTPFDMGAQMANAVAGSHVQQGMSVADQFNSTITGLQGGAAQASSAAMQAGGQSLQAVSMFPRYNSALAAGSTIGSALYSAYGAGAFDQKPQKPGTLV